MKKKKKFLFGRKNHSKSYSGSPEVIRGAVIAGGSDDNYSAKSFDEDSFDDSDEFEEELKSLESKPATKQKFFQSKQQPLQKPQFEKPKSNISALPKKQFSSNTVGKATEKEVQSASRLINEIKTEIGKAFFGHEDVVETLIRALLCDGHVLLEGVPGIAKTLVIKSLAKISGCTSKRVQFTVDLLPTDITGLTTYDPNKGFEIVKGPIFANFIIADEINRSPPKTQSALLEAMQEKQVSIGKETYKLPVPFFVMANQNPLETEGVYSLPEAQVDRFLFKVIFGYPKQVHEERVMEQNTSFRKFEEIDLRTIASPQKIIAMQKLTHKVYLDEKIKKYIMSIIQLTRNKNFKYGEYIEMGGSPRASINTYIAAKAEAVLRGRTYVLPADVDKVVYDVLRHRLILSYRAQAENITPDKVITEILNIVRSS